MPIRPILIVWTATLCFILGDAGAKFLNNDYGMPIMFIAWVRFVIGALMLLPISGLTRAELPFLTNRKILLRSALTTAAIYCFVAGVSYEQLPLVYAGFFVSPILSYFLAAYLLGEQITRLRTLLLAISFIGVLIVLRPGFGMTLGMMFGVGAGILHGSYMVATRAIAADYRPRFLLFSQFLIGSLLLAPLALSGPIPAIAMAAVPSLLLNAGGSVLGNYLLVIAHRQMPASTVAPLIYLQLVNSLAVGWILFSDLPDAWAFVGLAIIFASGVASFWLAQKKG